MTSPVRRREPARARRSARLPTRTRFAFREVPAADAADTAAEPSARWYAAGSAWCRGRARRQARLAGRHPVFTAMLAAAVVVRLAAVVGYAPALWFNDSFEYLGVALRPEPYVVRPSGYSFFLMLLEPFHSFRLVVVVQHLLGLAVAVMIYMLLRRHRTPGWLAALATGPQLFDGYQIQIEHMVMAETLFTVLAVAAVVALLWWRRPTTVAALVAGGLLAGASLTRTVGLPLAVVAGGWLLARRPGWRPLLAFCLALLIPLGCYGAWFQAVHGRAGIVGSDGVFLYSRTTSFVDCARTHPPADLAVLCPREPPEARQPPSNYIWHAGTPLDGVPGEVLSPAGEVLSPAGQVFSPAKELLAGRFARRAIVTQPLDYAGIVIKDFSRTFGPRLTDYPNAGMVRPFLFHVPPDPVPDRTYIPGGSASEDVRAYEHGDGAHRLRQPFASWLEGYQLRVAVPGPALGLLLLGAVLGAGLAGRYRPRLRAPLVLTAAFAVTLLLVPPATAGFDHRYVLPALAFLGAAAALGCRVLATGIAGLTASDGRAGPCH
ncbi:MULTISPECIES: hypothetical protein [Protofrankia]|uniref:Glycosyltransferase RgtA/B/C/D-like domain-containing protein n=1 Tax=Candidatus Protofrankia datiscae TaxID=2716812 RepID=F8AWR7_9ACTN|nr:MULTISPECIES: hypothetical protein [Protofrankia]AEH10292.1 hypothetical protein FsymDg_2975 [Candidatus Protofrankia datiscae]